MTVSSDVLFTLKFKIYTELGPQCTAAGQTGLNIVQPQCGDVNNLS